MTDTKTFGDLLNQIEEATSGIVPRSTGERTFWHVTLNLLPLIEDGDGRIYNHSGEIDPWQVSSFARYVGYVVLSLTDAPWPNEAEGRTLLKTLMKIQGDAMSMLAVQAGLEDA